MLHLLDEGSTFAFAPFGDVVLPSFCGGSNIQDMIPMMRELRRIDVKSRSRLRPLRPKTPIFKNHCQMRCRGTARPLVRSQRCCPRTFRNDFNFDAEEAFNSW